MPRLARRELGTSFFHVMTQGINKEKIFETDMMKDKYITLMKKYINNINVDVVNYCVMPNHCHMLIYTENIENMSKYMKCVNREYAEFYNWYMERAGYVFRDRYKSQPIYDQKHLYQCINYIHLNPVKAKIVDSCEKYKYSSYNDFIKNKFIKDSKFLKNYFKDKDFYTMHTVEKCSNFLDDEYDKNEVMDEYISNFCNNYKMSLDNIMKRNEIITKLIKQMLKSGYITKKDIQEKLSISYWKIRHLTEQKLRKLT